MRANLGKFLVWESTADINVGADGFWGDEVVWECDWDHDEGDNEKDAADNDASRFGNFRFHFLTHVDAEQLGFDESGSENKVPQKYML